MKKRCWYLWIAAIVLSLICCTGFAGCSSGGIVGTGETVDYSEVEIEEYSGTSSFSFFIDGENKLYASGSNGVGQLGINDTRYLQRNLPLQVMDSVKQVSAGRTGFAVAVTESGELYAWGMNMHSQLGQNTPYNDDETTNTIIEPTKIALDKKIVQVACGMYSVSALDENGSVWTWGGNSAGQLGRDVEISRRSVSGAPAQIPQNYFGGERVSSITSSDVAVFAITESGSVYSWGANDGYQLGTGSDDLSLVQNHPVEITELADKDIVKISAYSENCMALSQDGTVYVWGANNLRQLGVENREDEAGNPLNASSPIPLQTFADADGNRIETPVRIIDIACGGITNLVLDEDGYLYAFGDTSSGACGFNPQDSWPANMEFIKSYKVCVPMRVRFYESIDIEELSQTNPTQAKEILPVSDTEADIRIGRIVGTAGARSFFEDTEGNCWAMGNNGQGQACSGNNTDATRPVRTTFFRVDEYDAIFEEADYLTFPIIVIAITVVVFILLIIRCEIKLRRTPLADR